MALTPDLSYFAPLIYGLPYSSNLFTQGTQKRGWSPKPDVNYSSSEKGTAEATFGDMGSRGGDGGNTAQMNIGYGANPSANSYYGRQNTLTGLGNFAKSLGLSAGTVGAGLLAAGAPTGFALNAAINSAFNPMAFAGAFGQLGATAVGVDTRNTKQNVIGGLLGGLGGMVLGPVGGILGAIAAPFVGDMFGDLTNSRSYEKVRDIAEDLAGGYSAGRTLGTGFTKEMEANAKYSDVLGQGTLALNAAELAAQRSGVASNPRSNFDPVTGPQAMAREALEEQGVAGGWETQARINAAMKAPAVEAAKTAIDVARAAGLTPTTTVQAVGAPTAQAVVNTVSSSNVPSSVSAAVNNAQKVSTTINKDSFNQPSLSSSPDTGNSGGGSDVASAVSAARGAASRAQEAASRGFGFGGGGNGGDRGGRGGDAASAIGGLSLGSGGWSNSNSGKYGYGSLGGMLGSGLSLGGSGGMLGTSGDRFGGGGGRGNSGGGSSGKDTGNSGKGGSKGSSKN